MRLKSLIVPLYFAEQGIYTHLILVSCRTNPDVSSEDKILDAFEGVEEELGITYDQVPKKMPLSKPYKASSSFWQVVPNGKPLLLTALVKTHVDLHGLDLKVWIYLLFYHRGRLLRRMNELTQPLAPLFRHLGLSSEDDF